MVLFRIVYLAFNFVEQSYFYILVIHVYKFLLHLIFVICIYFAWLAYTLRNLYSILCKDELQQFGHFSLLLIFSFCVLNLCDCMVQLL